MWKRSGVRRARPAADRSWPLLKADPGSRWWWVRGASGRINLNLAVVVVARLRFAALLVPNVNLVAACGVKLSLAAPGS